MLNRSDLDDILRAPDPTPQGPPLSLLEQLARGGIRGASMGFAPDFWEGSPHGGIAETLGEVGGGLLPGAALTPLGVGGVAMAGRAFPWLLRGGKTAAEVVSAMPKFGFKGLGELSGLGQAAALGGSTAMQTGLEKAAPVLTGRGDVDQDKSILMPTLLSMGIGGALSKIGSGAAKAAEEVAGAVPAAAGAAGAAGSGGGQAAAVARLKATLGPDAQQKLGEIASLEVLAKIPGKDQAGYIKKLNKAKLELEQVKAMGYAPSEIASEAELAATGRSSLVPPPIQETGVNAQGVFGDTSVRPPAGSFDELWNQVRGVRPPVPGVRTLDDIMAQARSAGRLDAAAESVGGAQAAKFPAGAEFQPKGFTQAAQASDEELANLMQVGKAKPNVPSNITDDQVYMILKQAGIPTNSPMARELAEQLASGSKSLPGPSGATYINSVGEEVPDIGARSYMKPFHPRMETIEGKTVTGEVDPSRTIPYRVAGEGDPMGFIPPGKTPVTQSEGLSIVNQADKAAQEIWQSRIREIYGVDPARQDIALIQRAARRLMAGSSDAPFDIGAAARAGAQAGFGDGVRIAADDGVRESLAAGVLNPRLLGTAFSRGYIQKLVMKAPFLPMTWRLEGTPAADLPYLMDKANSLMGAVVRDAVDAMPNVMKWSPETKKTVDRLFFTFQDAPREAMDAAVQRLAPEAVEGLPELRQVMDIIRAQSILDGVLRPNQYKPNYFPVIRDTRWAGDTGTLKIERGAEYVPQMVQDSIRARIPNYAKARTWTDVEDLPQKLSFDEKLQVYLRQYARHRVISDLEPEMNRMLASLEDPATKQVVKEHVNHWLGGTSRNEAYSRLANLARDYQFQRTIGFNIFTPLINTLQRLNTFAMVSPRSFAQAFADRHDPERMALLGQAGLDLAEAGLEKLGMANVGRQGLWPTVGEKLGGLVSPEAAEAGSAFGEKLQKAASGLFEKSETNNRIHAFLAGVREAEAKGITDLPSKLEFGRRVMQETQFIQSAANAPAWARSEFGKTMYQFQSFRMNQTHFMLRLADTAIQGAKEGDWSKVTPFLKFWIPSIALGGAALPGDWMHDGIVRAMFGRTMATEGIPELFGLSLTHQLGLGTIGAEDVNSFFFYIPGPSVGNLQAVMTGLTGKNFGRGMDVTNFGEDVTPQTQAAQIAQSLPFGIQANRVLQALRLYQNDGEYRKALDMSQAFGLQPSEGPLMADKAANYTQMFAQAIGMQSSDREQQRKTQDTLVEMQKDLSIAQRKAAEFMAAGRNQDAWDVMQKFHDKHSDQLGLTPPPEVSKGALRKAQQRMYTGPTEMRGKTLPKDLRQSEAAMGPPESLWSHLSWGTGAPAQ